MKKLAERITIGLTTPVVLFGKKGKKEVVARVDTGATKSSMDFSLARELGLGPIVRETFVKAAHGSKSRPVILAEVNVSGELISAEFTLADRAHMKYRMLIGQNVLKKGFLIDPLLK